jgi:hypothetical protein
MPSLYRKTAVNEYQALKHANVQAPDYAGASVNLISDSSLSWIADTDCYIISGVQITFLPALASAGTNRVQYQIYIDGHLAYTKFGGVGQLLQILMSATVPFYHLHPVVKKGAVVEFIPLNTTDVKSYIPILKKVPVRRS